MGILVCASSVMAQSERQHKLLIDWAGLTRYGSEDTEIRAPKPGENRVVFLGNQVTEWIGRRKRMAPLFPGKPYTTGALRTRAARRCWCGFVRTSSNCSRKR